MSKIRIRKSQLVKIIREELRHDRVRKMIQERKERRLATSTREDKTPSTSLRERIAQRRSLRERLLRRRAQRLNEQMPIGPRGPGRPFEIDHVERSVGRPLETGGEAYSTKEFITYLRAEPGAGQRGRPTLYEVDFDGELRQARADQILGAYDPDGEPREVYSLDGEFLAVVPMDRMAVS